MIRWKMNRIGFVNFWLYDDETFDFEDGKLLLRGQNGSGKSITTQSFIPFILDGDRTPSRLDPFGSSDRRMEYYFLGEEGRDEATGYLFLEFAKEATGEFRTIGIGQRARRGKPMDFWGFILLDGQRIGRDICLYKKVGSTRIPLEKNELKKMLGDENCFTDVPGEYKALVNKHIFGFSKMEQYDQFIRLLVKVRAPKLSKELKPTKVYEILNDSLQTLTDEDLRAMVDAMEKMDGIQESLDGLNRAFSDVRAIRKEYTRYNQYMLAKKGQAYLVKQKEVQAARKNLSVQEEKKQQMTAEQKEKRIRKEEIENRSRVVEAELVSLYDTDMEEADRKLEQARESYSEIEKSLERWDKKIEDWKGEIQRTESGIRSLDGELELQRGGLRRQKEELDETQETLQWEGHEDVLRLIGTERLDGTEEIGRRLGEYKKQIVDAKTIVEQFERIQQEFDEVTQRAEECRKEKREREQEEEAAQKELFEEQNRLIAEIYEWGDEGRQWRPEENVLRETERVLREYHVSSDGEKIKKILAADFEEKRRLQADRVKETEGKREECSEQLAEAEEEIYKIQNAVEMEPMRDEKTKNSRKAMKEAGIDSVPFYRVVEFADGLGERECARLEAQLERMGILDALVVTKDGMEKIKTDCPEFADAVLYVEQKGDSTFGGLAVNEELDGQMREAAAAVLSHIYETEQNGGDVYLSADGCFRQGILAGKADKEGEAEYVGELARKRKKERQLSALEQRKGEILEELEGLQRELEREKKALDQLEAEYRSIPDFIQINSILEQVRVCRWNLEQVEESCRRQEKKEDECSRRRDRIYQKMLQECRGLPYGRTYSEYQEAWDAVEEYQRLWQEIREGLLKAERYLSDIVREKERMEQAEMQLDEAFYEKRRCQTEGKKQEILIQKYEEYLNRPKVKEQAKRIAALKSERNGLSEEIGNIRERLASLDTELRILSEGEEARKTELQEKIGEETWLRKYFEEELALRLVLDQEAGSLGELAKEAQEQMRDSDRGREPGELFNALYQVYQKHNASLFPYGTTLEDCFAGDREEDFRGGPSAVRSRVRLVSVWNGKKVYFEEFYQILKTSIEETELLIQQKDRELFEDILSQTISRQLTDRIAESRKWVKDMSALMKNMETSMGLTFSLDWKPKTAEDDAELDTAELEQILLRDKELLTMEDISQVAAHFRSKIQTEKMKQEETGGVVNYMELVRETLDYRKWFEFRMSYRKEEEAKKPLTNAAFNRFSGGEKAMAMYIPLFAAVNAQYQKAEKMDYPRIIALDEAFAGVDDKNISSMFDLVHILDFDYIMNSQALWGCYENVRGLRIAELLRPLNSRIVTVIRYTWNGHERILDEQ